MTAALLAAAGSLLAQTGPGPAGTHLPADVIALACAPTLAHEPPVVSLLITGGQDASTRYMYRPGDLITINGGSDNGIEVGQEYYVRRVEATSAYGMSTAYGMSRTTQALIRTAGWVRVYAVDKTMSLVTVTHACDIPIEVGEYLEPFTVPIPPVPDANAPKAQRENYGHILVGSDRRTMFAKNDFFTIDRGTDHGVTLGARYVIYRDKRRTETAKLPITAELPPTVIEPEFLFEIGDAVVVKVQPESSTLLATTSRSAFMSGDYAAIRK